ncbi:unnamed protein product [Aspergillus niger]|uniref:Unnamed protein product n=1 Tax=Aspergillus niger TaxID=5061 RepID=A0A124BYZ6_ASPNG|nr:unnamed protein product [Aspergillus niger]
MACGSPMRTSARKVRTALRISALPLASSAGLRTPPRLFRWPPHAADALFYTSLSRDTWHLLHKSCTYDTVELNTPENTPSPASETTHFGWEPLTPAQIKHAIIQRLDSATPDSVLAQYIRSINPWFPFLSHLAQRQLPSSWHDASLSFTMLSFCIVMLDTRPPLSEGSICKSLYLWAKSWTSLIEGLGIHSLELVQARTLITLFEVVHGLYPAAYISVGATARATDALNIHSRYLSSPDPSNNGTPTPEVAFIWCGTYTLDRYIAIESGSRLSLTGSVTPDIHDGLRKLICPSLYDEDHTSAFYKVSRLYGAADILDKMHTALNNPTGDSAADAQHIMLLLETASNLQAIVTKDIGYTDEVYSGALSLCNTGLFLAYENASKLTFIDEIITTCNTIGTMSLNDLLATLAATLDPFVNGTTIADFDRLSPFTMLMVYRAAALVTQRLLVENTCQDNLRMLRIFRGFLRTVSERWLCCERYLELLDENTTPRLLKFIEQGQNTDSGNT